MVSYPGSVKSSSDWLVGWIKQSYLVTVVLTCPFFWVCSKYFSLISSLRLWMNSSCFFFVSLFALFYQMKMFILVGNLTRALSLTVHQIHNQYLICKFKWYMYSVCSKSLYKVCGFLFSGLRTVVLINCFSSLFSVNMQVYTLCTFKLFGFVKFLQRLKGVEVKRRLIVWWIWYYM